MGNVGTGPLLDHNLFVTDCNQGGTDLLAGSLRRKSNYLSWHAVISGTGDYNGMEIITLY